ncbi:MAG: hypothetical protein COT74_05965 [Bdellovibrionales bacterium CG10_big_fil_rev_8_21_14_0_10_45_34]|nr:MAG: hypothetical protein COT74_05965 [Bdellovibrionales bacterium CG10_big_fil_rev_8_21_14_0_10_45_34]
MKSFIRILSVYSILLSATIVSAQDSNTSLESWKWGAGFGVLRNGYQGGFDITSPGFSKWGPQDANLMSIFLDLGFIELPDSVLNANNKLQDSTHLQSAIGLRATNIVADRVQGYSKLGVNFINWDSKIKNADGSAASWGMLLTFGADFFMGPSRYIPFGAKTESAFVELGWRMSHKRSDAISGEPALFNGFGINFGYRMHY